MFIVIEGDNGTGKTTVSEILNTEHGFEFITIQQKIRQLENHAKCFETGSMQRYEAFLNYNRACGEQVMKYKKSLLARYWVSTVAAAYADGLFDLEEALRRAEKLRNTMVLPDRIFRLKCAFDTRIGRIKKRALTNGNDDITDTRDSKYSLILDKLQDRFAFMTEIPTDGISPKDVAMLILYNVGGVV